MFLPMDPRPHLFGSFPEEIAGTLRAAGIPVRDEEARRILAHRLVGRGPEHAARRPVGRRHSAAVESLFDPARLEVLERTEDPADRFVKYLFRSPDGALHEAVRIPLLKPACFTVCLSSQAGCAMRCAFCATGRLGLARSLLAWEMVDAFLRVRDEAPGRVTGAVFMGQGEPFHNYDAVIRAARMLSHPCGGQVRGDAITISTVGLVPQIRRYAREAHPFRLIVSLTSAVPERRAALVPVASRWSLEELAGAIREYARGAPGLTTVAWVLMGGVNDGPEEVEALRRLLGGVRLRVNLIDVNDPRPGGFRRASYSGGAGRHAACGMLASTRWEGAAGAPGPA